jgi:catechol 2,3-dioxygenase-like lactoylglutathione lyase family enzyme
MESVISDLVSRFEKGRLTRRELVRGLAMLAGAGTKGASAQEPVDWKGSIIDHVSIQVADLQRSTAFYTKLFGFTVLSEDKPNGIVRMGFTKPLVSINPVEPTGIVDHFAIGMTRFNRDAVNAFLKERGHTTTNNPFQGFSIKDPDGVSIQFVQDADRK